MKKKLTAMLLVLLLTAALILPAYAETFTGASDWNVRFTADKAMDSNFKSTDLEDYVAGLQPGDDITFRVALKNEYSETVDWYITNEVLYSLEDRSNNSATAGGAYEYGLSYYDTAGKEHILYSSDAVGGDTVDKAGEGLHEATDSLSDFFYLDTIKPGGTGYVVLSVALDGETQGNDYQDTLADLQLNFAVELNKASYRYYGPKTGDTSNITLWLIAAAVSGVVLLVLAIVILKRSRRREDDDR